ncbi:tail assembly protein [Enterobacter hormaechei]|uniref:tail assembly protein n=3 Tax=Enterobacter hormaechei TaxID=158836 RepID=UPI0005EF8666|nr:tail assembly protein [Enterobacter hormaechei]ELC6320374.1 tail assembly protein [Enterobacter hormaechei]ELD3481553.1 tail assembly protein [Enterobacter hormaechei]KJM98414.1 phage tail assembly protein [Enterobacter hormaechei subsp. steigerwaltii]KJN13002.1 phage tail assembly protein [Enterobacter hormaechei subsp. steigerwaltii]KTJ47762.1 phage tail protein [Enterobacter hormaechei subsp. xiangfangensis]
MERKTVIKLSGSMAQRFGRTHRRALTSASEVFRALSNTIDGFDAYLREARAKGLDFVIFRDRRNIGHEEFELLGPGDELRIIPVIRGSKRAGVFQALLGTALVAAAIWMPGVSIAASNLMFSVGAAMAVGGVVQMLSPQVAGLRMRQEPDNKPSYAFGGPVNTTASGNPVPLLYGQREIGGAIISAGVYAEDQQ